MSDGQPNRDRNGGSWSSWDHEDTANHYAGENDNRQHEGQDRALIVNATSLGLESPWLEHWLNRRRVITTKLTKIP